jgi:hypothetical protein
MKKSLIARNEHYNQLINKLFSQLESYSHEALNRKPANGGWSAMQTVHHLILTDELSLAYLKKKMSFGSNFEKAGLAAQGRAFLLWLYLNAPFKFKAPKMVGDENLPDSAVFAEARARWEKTRAEWKTFFENLPEELAEKAVYKHPVVGRLSWPQTLVFLEGHFKRHEKQIHRALK